MKGTRPVPPGYRATADTLCVSSKILVCLRRARCFCPGPQLQMCNRHWGRTPYRSEKDHVWAERATNNAKSCGGSRKGWPNSPNHQRTLALQGGPCAQTSSRTCLTHRRLCMAVLRQLCPVKLGHTCHCVSYPTMRRRCVRGIWNRAMDVVIRCSFRISPTSCRTR